MRYVFNQTPLIVAQNRIIQNATVLQQARFIILQHLVDDTYQLISQLKAVGCHIDTIIGKPYSTDPEIKMKLKSQGYRIFSIEKLSNSDYVKIIRNSIIKAKQKKQKVIIFDIGGFFGEAIGQLSKDECSFIAGVVEDTMFGYQRYAKAHLPVPVFEIATSPLKELEGVFVGRAILGALEQILQDRGYALITNKTLVIGYGMISRNIARQLKSYGIIPSILEIDMIRSLRAYSAGFPVLLDRKLISEFELIFSATGTCTISLRDMYHLKNGSVLVSGSSQDVEFDVHGLAEAASKSTQYGPDVTEYILKGKRILLIRGGTPVNFRQKSVPAEVIDIMFAELIVAAACLISHSPTPNGLYTVSDEHRQLVARDWLISKHQ